MLTSHHFAMVMYHTTGSLASQRTKTKSMRWNGSHIFHVKTKLNLNSGTSMEKPTAVHREEALDFSKPRCSYLPPMWYLLGQRQLHPTNHCHHHPSLIACSGVSPLLARTGDKVQKCMLTYAWILVDCHTITDLFSEYQDTHTTSLLNRTRRFHLECYLPRHHESPGDTSIRHHGDCMHKRSVKRSDDTGNLHNNNTFRDSPLAEERDRRRV